MACDVLTSNAEDRPYNETNLWKTGAEMVVQLYIQRVFDILIACTISEGTHSAAQQAAVKDWLMCHLSKDEAAGLGGLSYVMIQHVIGFHPHITYAHPPQTKSIGTQQEDRFKAYYASGRWVDCVKGLFLWDDCTKGKECMWENEPFRQQMWQLHSIIEEELGLNSAQGFLQALASVAAHQLSIILQYDADHISITYKVFRNH